MATTLERIEMLEVRVDELKHEVLRLRAIVAGLMKPAVDGSDAGGARSDPVRDAEAIFSQHYANRKPLLS